MSEFLDDVRRARRAITKRLMRDACYFIGHRWHVHSWQPSPHTVHNYTREHHCARCGAMMFEKGYKNALEQGAPIRGGGFF